MRTLTRTLAGLLCTAALAAGLGARGATRDFHHGLPGAAGAADEPLWQVRRQGDGFDDGRVAATRDLDHPATFTPAFANKAEWTARAETLRRQVRVSLGLWPWPERTPLNAVVRGRIAREGYTIEHVVFESVPGHFVTGNLYRPAGAATGRRPAVLAPHGHWPNGRLQERSIEDAQKELAAGAEQTVESARYALQARPAMLARMGVVVFAWDMIGYAESTAIPHREGFTDAAAELRLQNFLGLTMWNAMRAVDFLVSLPDVDASRIGVNGASGGGTQSLLLAAIDERVAAAVPAVMVGGNMQGGCICENAPLLRLGTNNIELTALAAPRPVAAVAANDWTVDFMTKGLPELKTIYTLAGAPDAVAGRHFDFPHNDNQVSREYAYAWFNQVFKLGQPEPIKEEPFVPVAPAELRVFDATHPRPAAERDAAGVRRGLAESSDRQVAALAKTPAALADVIRGGVDAAIGDRVPAKVDLVPGSFRPLQGSGFAVHQSVLTRPGSAIRVPAIGVVPSGWNAGPVVVLVLDEGKRAAFEADGRTPAPDLKALLARGAAVLVPDVFLTGEAGAIAGRVKVKDEEKFSGYNTGYNRAVIAERASDILTVLAFARQLGGTNVALMARGRAAVWALAARAVAGDVPARTAIDLDGFEFDRVATPLDPDLLPGAIKYGGVRGLASLATTGRTTISGMPATPVAPWVPLPPGVIAAASAATADALADGALKP